VPSWQPRYSAPGPPPLPSPSEAYEGIPNMQSLALSLVQIAIGGAAAGSPARGWGSLQSARFDILILLQGRDPFAAKGFQFSSLMEDLRRRKKRTNSLL
jgi:hypothetical protein